MTYHPSFGSISHGTALASDLIPAFAYELKNSLFTKYDQDHVALYAEAMALENYDSAEAQDILMELFDALDEYAPPYGYFGAHPGDGSDYGYWLSEDFEQQMQDDEILKVSDLADIPARYIGGALVVNDHGNCTYYHINYRGDTEEIWAVV